MYRVLEPPAVHSKTASRAVFAASVVVVSVTSASELSVVVPAIAESTNEVMESFTTVPQVPSNSPVTGRAKPNRDVDAVVAILSQT